MKQARVLPIAVSGASAAPASVSRGALPEQLCREVIAARPAIGDRVVTRMGRPILNRPPLRPVIEHKA